MILNIHGIDGSCTNTVYMALTSIFGEERIVSPQIDYRSMTTRETLDMITELAKGAEFIVGNSFGGFYVSMISEQLKIPCILTNPCLRPDLYVEEITREYLDANNDLIQEMIHTVRNSSWLKETAHIIYSTGDEVLNPEHAKACLPECDSIDIEGLHRMSGETFERVLREMADKILNR